MFQPAVRERGKIGILGKNIIPTYEFFQLDQTAPFTYKHMQRIERLHLVQLLWLQIAFTQRRHAQIHESMAQLRPAESTRPEWLNGLPFHTHNDFSLLSTLAHSHPVQSLLSSIFTANESFVCPDIEPLSIASAIGDLDIIEKSVHGRQCIGAFQVEDYLRVTAYMHVGMQDLVIIA